MDYKMLEETELFSKVLARDLRSVLGTNSLVGGSVDRSEGRGKNGFDSHEWNVKPEGRF